MDANYIYLNPSDSSSFLPVFMCVTALTFLALFVNSS